MNRSLRVAARYSWLGCLVLMLGCGKEGADGASMMSSEQPPGFCGSSGGPCCVGDAGAGVVNGCQAGLECNAALVCAAPQPPPPPPPPPAEPTCGRYSGDVCCTGNVCNNAPGLSCCSAMCVDMRSDANHCGSCNAVCDGTCNNGSCTPRMPLQTTECGTENRDCCTGTGETPCEGELTCVEGKCQQPMDPDMDPETGLGITCGLPLGECCMDGRECITGMACAFSYCVPDITMPTDPDGPDPDAPEGVGETCTEDLEDSDAGDTTEPRMGECIDTENDTCDGELHRGVCPGSATIVCCLPRPVS